MTPLIQLCTGLPLPLINIIESYFGYDHVIQKIQRTSKSYFLTLEIPYIYNVKPRIYQIKVNSTFRRALWREDTHTSIESLRLGASYVFTKEEIFDLVKSEKYIALNILFAQTSFTLNESISQERDPSSLGRWYRTKNEKYYLDRAANNIADAIHSAPSEKIKDTLLSFYKKYKKKEDLEIPELQSVKYGKWIGNEYNDQIYKGW